MATTSPPAGVRRRKTNKLAGAAEQALAASKARDVLLKRRSSWQAAAEHVASRRIYSILAGVVLGVAGVMALQVFYLEQPLPELLPPESMALLKDKLSSQIEWSQRVKEDLLASFDHAPLLSAVDERRPGQLLADERGVQAHSPVVLVPGFTSTGLEIWQGSECSKSYFRQRMWGTTRMLQQFMLNQKCWLEHVMLDRRSGLDPNGIRLRAASGLEAADYLIGGFWVWGKLVENLADIGYDSNNMFMAAYDWRLAPSLLETRDHYFTKLKHTIEMAREASGGRKVVLVTHSYATQVIYYFLKWVESDRGGAMGANWVEENIEALANIAGPTLGTVKAVSALLSGEMKDTAELGGLSKFLGYFFAPSARAALARSWSSVYTMLPIGGDRVWGTAASAPDDVVASSPLFEPPASNVIDADSVDAHVARYGSNGQIVRFFNGSGENYTASAVHDVLSELDSHLEGFEELVSVGIAEDPASSDFDAPKHWVNPLETQLPLAPSMKIFCLYGVGKPVERGYTYGINQDADDRAAESSGKMGASGAPNATQGHGAALVPHVLYTAAQDQPWVKEGIRYSDGDGTVPLVSLGYMCARGWRNPKYNPAGMQVRTREYQHRPVSLLYDPRGGPETADHVDIMGNHGLIRDVLLIAAGEYDLVPENISSRILDIADRIGDL